MDMTDEEKIKAYRMRVFDKLTWNQIARVLFPEAYETAPDLCELLLQETVRHWYKTNPEAPTKCWSAGAESASAAR